MKGKADSSKGKADTVRGASLASGESDGGKGVAGQNDAIKNVAEAAEGVTHLAVEGKLCSCVAVDVVCEWNISCAD